MKMALNAIHVVIIYVQIAQEQENELILKYNVLMGIHSLGRAQSTIAFCVIALKMGMSAIHVLIMFALNVVVLNNSRLKNSILNKRILFFLLKGN